MRFKVKLAGAVFALALPGVSFAQDRTLPPDNALKASEIIARIEARNDFRYLDEAQWDQDGYYEIVYFTGDKARVEIRINPVTGEPL